MRWIRSRAPITRELKDRLRQPHLMAGGLIVAVSLALVPAVGSDQEAAQPSTDPAHLRAAAAVIDAPSLREGPDRESAGRIPLVSQEEEEPVSTPPVEEVPEVNLRPAALALTAAGPDQVVQMNEDSVTAAARVLGLEVSAPLTDDDVREIAEHAWQPAREQLTLAGIAYGPDGPDRGDLEDAARQLGVGTKDSLHPADVQRIVHAGRDQLSRQFRAGRVQHGRAVGFKDLQKAAKRFGVDYGDHLSPVEARRIARTVAREGRAQWEAKHPTPVFARVRGVKLRMPSHNVQYAGFHQAASRGVAKLKPHGKVDTRVLPSRKRGTGRTTAIDIVLRPGEDVRAPVSGRVVEVTRYRLYGKYPDHRIRMVAGGKNGVVVTALHVKNPKVRPGDKVKAGRTLIAGSVRTFPFFSQVDAFSGKRWGHVHIEARRR